MTSPGAMPTRVRLNPSVRLRVGDRQGFLFDERTGRVYSLTATSALAATRLAEDDSIDDVVQAVVRAFDVDDKTARKDLLGFIDQLVREGLARPVDAARDRSIPRGAIGMTRGAIGMTRGVIGTTRGRR
jgi:coenzyme PQQ synthesis protein D (PqqD)